MNSLQNLHGFLRRRSFYPLVLASALACAVLNVRFYLSASPRYGFLLWNLFLAWVPYGCALWADALHGTRRWGGLTVLLFGWLLFFPNAPYIITDFVHLLRLDTMPLWFDLGLVAVFAWTGCLLGFASLRIVHGLLDAAIGRLWAWTAVCASLVLSGVGIYVGRFLRWNSWDVLTDPVRIAGALLDGASDPLAHRRALGVTLLFAGLMLVSYWTIISLRTDRKPDPA
jgi:uncharacterized membrane protein